jgi:hypothetical protein
MSKGDPVMYEELTPEHKQKFDEIKALFEAQTTDQISAILRD